MSRSVGFLLFLVLTVGGGLAIGYITLPGEWYAGLVKPSFNPPNWIFAPVWTILYVLIAVAGWRVAHHEGLYVGDFHVVPPVVMPDCPI